jgi:hypothetical protein
MSHISAKLCYVYSVRSDTLFLLPLGPEGGSVHDNGRFASPHYSHGEEQVTFR